MSIGPEKLCGGFGLAGLLGVCQRLPLTPKPTPKEEIRQESLIWSLHTPNLPLICVSYPQGVCSRVRWGPRPFWPEAARALLFRGADANACDVLGETALVEAFGVWWMGCGGGGDNGFPKHLGVTSPLFLGILLSRKPPTSRRKRAGF